MDIKTLEVKNDPVTWATTATKYMEETMWKKHTIRTEIVGGDVGDLYAGRQWHHKASYNTCTVMYITLLFFASYFQI